MTSIRTFTGEIRLCLTCGQPCYLDVLDAPEFGPAWAHFSEQWDGIHCPQFPLADDTVKVEWDETSLEDLKATYPDTYPRPASSPA